MQIPVKVFGNLNRSSGTQSQMVEYDILNDPSLMTRICGTYDAYQCEDCKMVLSALKRGDPGFEEHLWHGGGRCRYFQIKYAGREEELIIAMGKLRFQRGFIALPHLILSANYGYVPLSGVQRCIVCACSDRQHHHVNSACVEMARRLTVSLKHLTLLVQSNNVPLFSPLRVINNFSVLGESANMYHLPDTVDTHVCFDCNVTFKDFVENDTLLGEHIYHVYNQHGQCSYLTERFKNQRNELMVILGKERYRRGSIAFETTVTKNECGFIVLNGQKRCLVCSALTTQTVHLPTLGHYPHCNQMKQILIKKLQNMKLLL